MQIIVKQIDIPRTKDSWPGGIFNPAYVASRESGVDFDWLIADSPVPDDAAGGIEWATARGSEYIRIPLFEYLIKPQGNFALTFAFKTGVIAASLAPILVKKIYCVTGTPVEIVQDKSGQAVALSYWLGFAFSYED